MGSFRFGVRKKFVPISLKFLNVKITFRNMRKEALNQLWEIQREIMEAIKNAPPPYENERLEPFLTPKEVAKKLKVSYGTVIYWIKTGKLRAIKIGGRYRISHLWLKQFAGKGVVSDYLP